MPRFRNMLLAALAVSVLALGAFACNDDDNTAQSDSDASAQDVDSIHERLARNEMVVALLGIGALPLHDIDEAIAGGEEIPGDAIPAMRTVIRLVTITEWDADLQADADAIKEDAEAFIGAAETDDHGALAEAATAVHDGWHDFSEDAWEVVAPGTGGSDDHGGGDETPHADETPHEEETPHDDSETPEATP